MRNVSNRKKTTENSENILFFKALATRFWLTSKLINQTNFMSR